MAAIAETDSPQVLPVPSIATANVATKTILTTLPQVPLMLSAFRQPLFSSPPEAQSNDHQSDPNTSRNAQNSSGGRIYLRPLSPLDLSACHLLRTQHEVMQWTSTGTTDKSIAQTQTWLDRNLPPNDETNYVWAICLTQDLYRRRQTVGEGDDDKDDETKSDEDVRVGRQGELIGIGGVHRFSSSIVSNGSSHEGDGKTKTDEQLPSQAQLRNPSDATPPIKVFEAPFPELGYMIRHEFWNLGLTTEFMSLFLSSWWALEREPVVLQGLPEDHCFDSESKSLNPTSTIHAATTNTTPSAPRLVHELLAAVTVRHNLPSQAILRKAGFELVREWPEEEDDRSSRRNIDRLDGEKDVVDGEGDRLGERKKVIVGMMSWVLRRPDDGQ